MKKTGIVLIAIIFISLSITACQKAKEEGEGKKETQKQETQAQREEVKQQPSEIPQETKPEIQPAQQPPYTIEKQAKQETQQITPASAKETEFKEPVLLWEREFDPPIREISDQNSNGDFLAVQVKTEEGSGRPLITKLLVIDSKGKTKREELLPKKKKVTIPADQLWLTASSDEELKKLKKAKKPKQIEALGREMYASGNGDYYATVIQYGNWYEFEYKDKNGKTLWKINPKDNYGFSKAYISYDGSRIVIIDMGGLGGGDDWEVLGQRVYFYDNTGKLLKDYDWGERMEEWLNSEEVVISKNSHYVASSRGQGRYINNRVILFDKDGKTLYSKKLWERHRIGTPTNNGDHLVYRDETCLLSKDGIIIWKEDSLQISKSFYRSSGKSIFNILRYDEPTGERVSIYRLPQNDLLFSSKAIDLFGDSEINKITIEDILENDRTYFLICGHSQNTSNWQCILLDLKSKQILYKGGYLGRFANEGGLTIAASKYKSKRVLVYSLKGGQ